MLDLTVVIPIHDDPYIKECLTSFSHENVEIIVVGQSVPKSIKKIIKQFSVKFIEKKEKNAPRSRNIGAKMATKKNIVFIDSDCIIKKGYAKKLLNQLKKHEIVKGPVIYLGGKTLIGKYYARMLNRDVSTKPHMEGYTPNLAFQKKTLEKIGQLDEKILSCDDYDRYIQIKEKKYSIHYCTNTPVFHLPVENYFKSVRTYYRYGKSQFLLYQKNNYQKVLTNNTKNLFLLPVLFIRDLIEFKSILFALYFRSLRLSKAIGFFSKALTHSIKRKK